jgi:hypothetical protein
MMSLKQLGPAIQFTVGSRSRYFYFSDQRAALRYYKHNRATPNTASIDPTIVYKEIGCPLTHSARAGSYTGPRQLIVEASPKGSRMRDVTNRTGARFVTKSAPAVVACQSRRVI